MFCQNESAILVAIWPSLVRGWGITLVAAGLTLPVFRDRRAMSKTFACCTATGRAPRCAARVVSGDPCCPTVR